MQCKSQMPEKQNVMRLRTTQVEQAHTRSVEHNTKHEQNNKNKTNTQTIQKKDYYKKLSIEDRTENRTFEKKKTKVVKMPYTKTVSKLSR